MISVCFQGKPFNITVIQVYALASNAEEATRPTRTSRTNTQRRCLFHYRELESKSRKETPGVTGKFGLGVQNEAGQRLIEFCQENTLVIANTLFQQHKKDATHGHHQMVNTEIRLIILFEAKMEKLYTVNKNKTGS